MPGGFNAKERRRRSACRALGSPRWSVPSPGTVSLWWSLSLDSGVTSPRSTQEFCGQMGADGSKRELPMVSQHGLLLGRNRRIRRQQWEQNQDMSKRQHCQGMLASSPAFLDTIMLLEPSHWHQICPMDLDPGDEPATRPL